MFYPLGGSFGESPFFCLLPTGPPRVYDVAFSPRWTEDGRVWATAPSGLHVSDDRGRTWVRVDLGVSSDGYVSLMVKDDGEPIRSIDQERIFEPYQRSDQQPQPGSIGLGLSVSRHLARLMGGDLS